MIEKDTTTKKIYTVKYNELTTYAVEVRGASSSKQAIDFVSYLLNELDNVKESAWHLNLKAILMIIGFGLAMRKKSQSMSLLLFQYSLMKEAGVMFRLITMDSVVNAIEGFIQTKKTANGMK